MITARSASREEIDRERHGYEHVVFDLDGTLIDSRADLTEAVNHMLGVLGRPLLPPEVVVSFVGEGARRLVERALRGADADLCEHGLHLFLDHYGAHLLDHTRPYAGVRELLAELARRGARVSVLTNKPAAASERILAGLGLRDAFAAVVGGDTLARRKPAPDGLLHLAVQMRTPLERMLLVGDSEIDRRTAASAGVAFCAAAWGFGRFADPPPTRRADAPAAVLDAVDEHTRAACEDRAARV